MARQGLLLCLALGSAAFGSVSGAQAMADGDDDLRAFAVHINRTPPQPWPGFGVYLGSGYVLTASHVPANVVETKPHVVIAGQDLPAALVKQGSLETVDLTLLSIDTTTLSLRIRMSRAPLCDTPSVPGETIVVATPESTARSHILPPRAVPPGLRDRFGTVFGDVATTGNSGSGVFDAWRQCLLGIVSRKISIGAPRLSFGAKPIMHDIAKYFVPASEIRAFLPSDVSY